MCCAQLPVVHGHSCSLVCVPPTCGLQLKQVKELEQEQEVLLQGLEMMARGRDWYQQQLQRVQERQRHLGQSRAGAVSAGTGVPGAPLGSGQPQDGQLQ